MIAFNLTAGHSHSLSLPSTVRLADLIGRVLGNAAMNMIKNKCTTNSMPYAHHSVSNQNPKSKSNPKSQTLIDITNKDTMEGPPPHSIDGIRARRT